MASRRTPLLLVVASTALALVVAVTTVALLGGDGESSADDGGAGSGSGSGAYTLTPAGELPSSAADVTLASLGGGADRKLGELLGSRPVVVNFYASWCQPCIREMPAFERVHQDLGDQVTIVGIAYQDADEDARATVERTGVTYPTFGDSGQDALTYFGGIGMPTTVFIDAGGTVVDVHSRAFDEEGLRSALRDRLGVR